MSWWCARLRRLRGVLQDCSGDDTCLANRRQQGDQAHRPNEQFFQYQREQFEQVHAQWSAAVGSTSGGLASLFGGGGGTSVAPFSGLGEVFERSPAIVALREELLGHVEKYVTSLGQQWPPSTSGGSGNNNDDGHHVKMFMWATVHNSCTSHLPHIHEVGSVHAMYVCSMGWRTHPPPVCCCSGER